MCLCPTGPQTTIPQNDLCQLSDWSSGNKRCTVCVFAQKDGRRLIADDDVSLIFVALVVAAAAVERTT